MRSMVRDLVARATVGVGWPLTTAHRHGVSGHRGSVTPFRGIAKDKSQDMGQEIQERCELGRVALYVISNQTRVFYKKETFTVPLPVLLTLSLMESFLSPAINNMIRRVTAMLPAKMLKRLHKLYIRLAKSFNCPA